MAAPTGPSGGLPEELLRVPDEQKRQQAVDSLRGYIYQVYQTLLGWLDLKDGDTLLLEVAEDYAVLAQKVLNAVQVKDTGRSESLTLKSPSVKAAIRSLWNFQVANPGRSVRVNYITTSDIGKEKQFEFPDGTAGLVYWRIATRDGVDVEPLRSVLLSLNLPGDVADFVKGASADELRETLLRRISWHCRTDELYVVKKTVDERLIALGRSRGLLSGDADAVRNALVHRILDVIVRKEDRSLTRTDFLRTFDSATTIAMPIATVRQMQELVMASVPDSKVQISDGSTFLESIDRVPLPPHAALRGDLV